jgi:hypothetical protein
VKARAACAANLYPVIPGPTAGRNPEIRSSAEELDSGFALARAPE